MLRINSQNTNNKQTARQINEQTIHEKSKRSNSSKNNPHPLNIMNQEIDYFIAGLGIEANRAARVGTMQKIHKEYSDVLMGIWCFKGTSSFNRSKII